MRLTVRVRVMLAAAGAVAVAAGASPWVVYLWHHIQTIRARNDYVRANGISSGSDAGIYRSVAVFAVGVLVVLGICYLLAVWALQPLGPLTRTLGDFGPQNLGQRNRLTGPRDELRRLGDAVDEMLDRFGASYDNQRLFAANASHELRTPLAVQRTLIEVSLDQPLTPEQTTLLTRQLLAANERNEALIEGLLVLSETDRGLLANELIVLDRVAAEIVARYEELAKRAEVTLVLEAEERVVRGERVLVERLVTNLIQNAIKYNRPDGTVHVEVGREPAIRVSNTGDVVPAESVPQLFEPFRRLSNDRTSNAGGAGLGLTIARSIAQAHGGTISAQPLSDGGLQLDVRLPHG